jgi:glycosyltransferase involved in cell wall biosynthesis
VLAPDGDVSALADAIGRLLADAPLRARLAAAARDLARATFVSWEKRTAMEMEIFDRLAASRPRAARG